MTASDRIVSSNLNLPQTELAALCRRFAVRELAVFGSVLREDFRADSDIDLLVEFEPEAAVGLFTVARMQRELSALLHREVDLVLKAGLKPLIREDVLRTSQIIYEN
jgi:predicted nucleotidyltransferase